MKPGIRRDFPEPLQKHTTMRMNQIAARTLTLLALVAPMQAFAAEPAKARGPSAEYERGYSAMEAKNWTKAYEIFSDLWAHPKGSDTESDVALNLGQAEYKLGKYRDAAEHLSIGVLMAPPDDADTKERASQGLALVKKKIGTLSIAAPDGTELAINGKPVGTAPIVTEVFVDPGNIKVTGKHPTKGAGESQFDVKAGEERKVELQLRIEPESKTAAPLTPPYSSSALDQPNTQTPTRAPIPINPPPPVEKKSGIETKTILLIAGGVVTLAATGTATYFGLKARSARDDADSLSRDAETEFGSHRCASTSAQDSSLCANIREKLETRSDASKIYNVMLPVAGAAAVATGLLYVIWPERKNETARFPSLVPVAEQHGGGLLVQGSF